MQEKNFFLDLLRTYFTLVTLITLAILVLGMNFDPDVRFGYEAFAAPLIYGICGTFPNVIMYSKRELAVKEFLFRKGIQFVLIEVTFLTLAYKSANIDTEQFSVVLGIGFSILVIFILVHLIIWVLDYLSARQMTKELILFQQKRSPSYGDYEDKNNCNCR